MASEFRDTIYPLANPKGVSYSCELCRKPATIICSGCRVTFYCKKLHQKTDWDGIHKRICKLFIALRAKQIPRVPFLPIIEEIQYKKDLKTKQQLELLGICRVVATRLVLEDKADLAIPAALQVLQLTLDLYGDSSVRLVTPYFILAEISIVLGQFQEAESYLSLAEWIILKTPDCPMSLHQKLYHTYGTYYYAKGETKKARRYLAEDIYFAAKEFGTDSIQTNGGYYMLANCFLRESKIDIAHALFAKVMDLWCSFLTVLMRDKLRPPTATETVEARRICLNEAEVAEGFVILTSIYKHREKIEQMVDLPRIAHCLAMLSYLSGDHQRATEYGQMVVPTPEHLGSEEFLKDAEDFMKYYVHWEA